MENLNDPREKRRYPRVLLDLPLEYRVLEKPHPYGGLVANASEEGLLIHSIRNIPIGTKLNIAVLFPKEFQLGNFQVLAEIVWKDIHWKEDWEGYQLGLKFVQILKEDHQKLKALLDEGENGEGSI